MAKKVLWVALAVIIIESIVIVLVLNVPFHSTSSTSSNNQTLSYIGILVSYSYTTSKTNGVESTQLIFTNKTFNYNGYITLQNNEAYNVTYDSDNPNQALQIEELYTTIGLIGNAEQASITNTVLTNNGANGVATLTVQNTGSSPVTISSATIDGNFVSFSTSPSGAIANGTSSTVTLTWTGTTFVNTAQYTIKLTTAKGNTVATQATYPGT